MPELADLRSAVPHLPKRFLAPGGLLVMTEPCEVTTILGPCVAVTLWCRRSHVAAICHAMLPADRGGGSAAVGTPSWKYVSAVVPEMLARFARKGGESVTLEIKLFGGADLLNNGGQAPTARIGPQNVELALHLLAERGLVVVASDVGGKTGRKLIFNTLTGGVRIKRLLNSSLTIP